MVSAGTPDSFATVSGEFCGSATNSAQCWNSSQSQRSRMNASLNSPSVTMTWASAVSTATLVPGRSARWQSASICADLTISVRRGSITISLAPWRSRFFMREAKTGCAAAGLAPITTMTSLSSTESKFWVPAEVPKAWPRPYPVGEWQTRAHVSTLLLPNPARISFCTRYVSSLVQRDEVMPPTAPRPYCA